MQPARQRPWQKKSRGSRASPSSQRAPCALSLFYSMACVVLSIAGVDRAYSSLARYVAQKSRGSEIPTALGVPRDFRLPTRRRGYTSHRQCELHRRFSHASTEITSHGRDCSARASVSGHDRGGRIRLQVRPADCVVRCHSFTLARVIHAPWTRISGPTTAGHRNTSNCEPLQCLCLCGPIDARFTLANADEQKQRAVDPPRSTGENEALTSRLTSLLSWQHG